jgi:hypothetical protein
MRALKAEEALALRKLYIGLAVQRAIEEIGQPFALGEPERAAEQILAEQLKADAFLKYQEQRGAAASDLEFDWVWLSIRDDLVREAKALEGMRK